MHIGPRIETPCPWQMAVFVRPPWLVQASVYIVPPLNFYQGCPSSTIYCVACNSLLLPVCIIQATQRVCQFPSFRRTWTLLPTGLSLLLMKFSVRSNLHSLANFTGFVAKTSVLGEQMQHCTFLPVHELSVQRWFLWKEINKQKVFGTTEITNIYSCT